MEDVEEVSLEDRVWAGAFISFMNIMLACRLALASWH